MDNGALLTKIQSIYGTGTFLSTGVHDFIMPGLEIDGVGEISLPLTGVLAKKIIKVANQAPFGKGSKTIVDTAVRSSHEIDASQVKFTNKKWDSTLKKIVKSVQKDLGLEDVKIEAKLYKLLIYQAGDFFLKHKDSEKEKGMFGTLVLNLPSQHEGGDLIIEFENKSHTINFSDENFDIGYAAFYTDCDHEVVQVTKGYRLNLVYNLIKKNQEDYVGIGSLETQIVEIEQLLQSYKKVDKGKPLVYILEHQYTPENFGLSSLKLNDINRVNALISAANRCGLYVNLGLMTHYVLGELDGGYDYYRGRNTYHDTDDMEMGEVIEESTTLGNWKLSDAPSIGEISKEDCLVLNELDYTIEEPIESENEDYTGNAGMTAEYWYHHGAVLIMDYSNIVSIWKKAKQEVLLSWMSYFNGNAEYAKALTLIQYFAESSNDRYLSSNTEHYFTPFIDTLIKGEYSPKNLLDAKPLIIENIEKCKSISILLLLDKLDQKYSIDVLNKILERQELETLCKLLSIFNLMVEQKRPPFEEIVKTFLANVIVHCKIIFGYDDDWKFKQEEKTKRKVVRKLISISSETDINKIAKKIFDENIERRFIHNILAPVLEDDKVTKNQLHADLLTMSINHLSMITKSEPILPITWKRDFTPEKYKAKKLSKEQMDVLSNFMGDEQTSTIEYAKAEAYRNEMERYIQSARLDITCSTLRKGSPYRLVLGKNNKSYDRKLKDYRSDLVLKEKLTVFSKSILILKFD